MRIRADPTRARSRVVSGPLTVPPTPWATVLARGATTRHHHGVHALCLEDTLVLRTVDRPTPGPDEALIDMQLAGICGTDLEITRGYKSYRGILGHEFVGRVRRCPGDPTREGTRVTADINLACGSCASCRAGQSKHCDRRRVMGIARHPGCFAEQVVVPIANLHAVPASVSDDQAVFTEPLAAAFELFESIPLGADTRVAVLGDGKLGLLVVLALRSRGIPLTAVGRHPAKLERVAGPGVRTCAPEQLGSERFDVVVDATGSPTGLALALDHVVARGTVALKSTFAGPVPLDATRVVVDEIRVVGSRCGPFDVALAAMSRGEVDPTPLIDARYPLAQAEAAMAHAARRGTLKVLLEGPGQ